ncbi:MAG: hypothetical protein JXA16_14190 [Bacteroidales bacterium]|nr:hypothetical protein [Bacteroidales bacterium]
MKKLNFFGIALAIMVLLYSCAEKVTEFSVQNNSTEVEGDLHDYLEIIDGTYKASLIGSDLKIGIKLKVLAPLTENIEFEEMRAELLDNTDMPLTGVGAFHLKYGIWAHADQIDKLKNALRKGEGEFAIQLEYDSWGACGRDEALKIASESAKSFSILTKAPTKDIESHSSKSSNSQSNVKTTSNSSNWDKVLDSYENYINQYIRLLKKANEGDMSAMTEYVSMMEKATDLAEKLDNADDDLTTSQMNRFIKLQTKLANAVAGL